MRRNLVIGLMLLGVSIACAVVVLTKPSKDSLADHPFWTKKPTSTDTERLIEAIQAAPRESIVAIKGDGTWDTHEPDSTSTAVWRSYAPRGRDSYFQGKYPNQRFAILDTIQWAARPTSGEVRAAVKKALDAAEYESR